MICAMCNTANYFDAKQDRDNAVILHRICTEGGCKCLHQVGSVPNAVSSEAR